MIVRCLRCTWLGRFFDGPASEAVCADCGSRVFVVAPPRLTEEEAFRWLQDRLERAKPLNADPVTAPVPVARVRLDRIRALAVDARGICEELNHENAADLTQALDDDLSQIVALCGEPLEPPCEVCGGMGRVAADCPRCGRRREVDDDTAKDRR